jgi:hypothetical protein
MPRHTRDPRPARRRASQSPVRPRIRSRLVKAGTLAIATALGGAVAAVAAPVGNTHAAAQAAPAVACALQLPAKPLTAQGLATPFRLVGVGGQSCHQADPGTAAFAQGLVLDPATGRLAVYNPLVVDDGTAPAVAPAVPTLPANAVVALWFGFNGDVLTLRGPGVAAGSCVGGLTGSPFGQFSYCNAPALFKAANAAIAAGTLAVPALGTAADGQSCLTTRDFGLVDQDQSDNVTTTYLLLPNGSTAQNTAAATTALAAQNPAVLANGSDNLLLDHFVDPALHCTPFTAPDLADPGTAATSLGLNELQAAADQAAPVALVPLNDPMGQKGGATSDSKTDLYRAGVDQPPLAQTPGSPAAYCRDLISVSVARTQLDKTLTQSAGSPAPAAAANLFAFLAQRLQASFTNLGCGPLLHQANPVHVRTNGAGVAVDATFDQPTPSPTPTPSPPAVSASPTPSQAASNSSTPPPPQPSSTPPTVGPTGTQSAPTSASPFAPAQGTMTGLPAAPVADHSTDSAVGAPEPPATTPGASAGAASPTPTATGKGPGTTTGAALTAGFEHSRVGPAGANPLSALSGPNPMSDTGFRLTGSRLFWALCGSFLVLCLSLLLRRRPRRR